MSEDQAATKLQATFRGHQARKQVAGMKEGGGGAAEGGEEEAAPAAEAAEAEAPAEAGEPEMSEDQAATKLQATFRGHQARKQVAGMKELEVVGSNHPPVTVVHSPADDHVAAAAVAAAAAPAHPV